MPWETRRYDGPLKPGDWVTHSEYGGHGIIVAINDENMSVLWSEEPRYPSDMSAGFVYAPYIPLQVTPTLFADPEGFAPKKGLRYYTEKVVRSFYGTITVGDIK